MNLTTDCNLSASFRHGETDPVFVRFNVHSNIEPFVEHDGIQAQSQIMCRQKKKDVASH